MNGLEDVTETFVFSWWEGVWSNGPLWFPWWKIWACYLFVPIAGIIHWPFKILFVVFLKCIKREGNEKFGIPLNLMIPNEDRKKYDHMTSVLHLANKSGEEKENPFLKWILQNREALLVNAFSPKNHNSVLSRYPECETHYERFIHQIEKSTKKESLSDLMMYRALA